jgi:glyoxylase-like metal-dependent hydrolase (beta-lactamase superfamily II)
MRTLWMTLLLAAGCGTSPTTPVAAPAAKKQVPGTATRLAADPRIGVYTSSPWGFSTSSYWIEGPEGLVFVDTQFLPSAAGESIEQAEKLTGKPVKLAIVLHPNPDKFNGTRTFQDRGIRVVTSQQVAALIPAIHTQRHGRFYQDHQPDYPNETPAPEVFGDATTELSAGGITVKAHVLSGPGCSKAHVVVEFDGHVFPGDLVAHEHHGWLEIGETPAWRQRLGEIKAWSPRFVHPGRGTSGGPERLAAMDAYLAFAIERVAAQRAQGLTMKPGVAAVIAEIKEKFPGYGHTYFLQIGVPAEWKRQAGQ